MSMFFCKEDDPTVDIGVVRIGDTSMRSAVWYETKDGSAKAGIKYTYMKLGMTSDNAD